jgi:hypothetical protein
MDIGESGKSLLKLHKELKNYRSLIHEEPVKRAGPDTLSLSSEMQMVCEDDQEW